MLNVRCSLVEWAKHIMRFTAGFWVATFFVKSLKPRIYEDARIISPPQAAASRHLLETRRQKAKQWLLWAAATRRLNSAVQRSHTAAWLNNFDGCLTCSGQETRQDGGRRHRQHCGWKRVKRPSTELQSAPVFYFSTPIEDCEIQTTPTLYQTISKSLIVIIQYIIHYSFFYACRLYPV